MKYISFFIVIAAFASCKSTNDAACDYYQFDFRAEVIEIKSAEGGADVILDFNNSSLSSNPQSLAKLRKIKITDKFVEINKIKMGNIYLGTISEIKEGDCEKMFVTFDFNFKEV